MALPLDNAVAEDVYAPLLSVTEPVGTGLLPPPLTATATERACAEVMVDNDGVTVMVGVVFAGGGGGVVVDPLPPPPHAVNVAARLTATQSAAFCCKFFIHVLPVHINSFFVLFFARETFPFVWPSKAHAS